MCPADELLPESGVFQCVQLVDIQRILNGVLCVLDGLRQLGVIGAVFLAVVLCGVALEVVGDGLFQRREIRHCLIRRILIGIRHLLFHGILQPVRRQCV